MIRVAETDEELARFAAIRLAASPRETASPPRRSPERLLLLWDDAGCGIAAHSDLVDSVTVQVFVRPEARRQGIGAALAERLVAHARRLGRPSLFATVDSLLADGVSFAERRGLVEIDREIELRRAIGEEELPEVPEGIELLSIAARPELLAAAWHAVGEQGYAELPTPAPVAMTLERWLAEEATAPDGSFVALVGGEIVAYAGMSEGGEHGLTAVARPHRRRGLATLLKRRQLAWAAAAGVQELVGYTQSRNDAMLRVDERLGYRAEPPWLKLKGPLR